MRKILNLIFGMLLCCSSIAANNTTNISLKPGDTLTIWQDEYCVKFPGNLQEYIKAHIQYPPEYADANIAGRIIVSFKIHRSGKTSSFKIIRGLDPLIDKEIIRVMKTMPKWIWYSKKRRTIKFLFPACIYLE